MLCLNLFSDFVIELFLFFRLVEFFNFLNIKFCFEVLLMCVGVGRLIYIGCMDGFFLWCMFSYLFYFFWFDCCDVLKCVVYNICYDFFCVCLCFILGN